MKFFFFPHPREREKVYLKKIREIYLVILILKMYQQMWQKITFVKKS